MAIACTSSGAIFTLTDLNRKSRQRAHHSPLRGAIYTLRRSCSLQASSTGFSSRRNPSFLPEAEVVVGGGRGWREIKAVSEEEYIQSGDYGEYEEEEEEDRSLDLLLRFLHNFYRNISRRVRKAARSVLPVPIPTKLVSFAVDGMLLLAFLWILKAFLEVICTFGSMVFVSILLVRGVWTGIAYFQEVRLDQNNRLDDDDDRHWTRVQPAT